MAMQSMFNSVSSEQPRFRSGAVARMVRIPVSTLRIWERRYQVVGPSQTASGHRLYSGADVERLLLIKQLSELGHAIGSIARLPNAALLEIADARAALSSPAAHALRPRAVLLGLGLPRRLGALALQRVGTWADLAAAEAALAAGDGSLRAELLVAELATLQPSSAERLLALAQRLGVQRSVLVYGFGADAAAQRLRAAGWQPRRAPLEDAELRSLVDHAAAALAGAPPAAVANTATTAATAPPADAPSRLFDDAALAQLAAASSTVACECPRHLAELVMLLGNFETYSAECAARGPADAALHAHLQQVAASARAMFEGALLRVAQAELIPLPPRIAALVQPPAVS